MTPEHSPMLRVALRVLDESVVVESPRPEGPVRMDQALPFFWELDDKAIGVAIRRAESEGKSISCCKGCAACCKAQPVPVTPPEAYSLYLLVESMPPPRRDEIRGRFADRVRRLREAGLDQHFLQRQSDLTKDEARTIAERYFRLGLVCPFLEDDSCGIYEVRPFVCRQYLVTSPAALCVDPFNNPVRPVPMPIAAAGATLQAGEKLTGTFQFTVPLVLALEYAESRRQELEQTFPARPLYQTWLEAVSK
ncbi:MAG: YkgJ family cysteine cluster protein [Planctomycetes bacterium]|nr:YkgJ family cysteine cluster protein [Planctomycetota bacterium]